MAEPALDDLDLVIKTMATTIVDNADYFAQLDSIVGVRRLAATPCRNGFRGRARRGLRQLGDKPSHRRRSLKKIGVHDCGQGRRRVRPKKLKDILGGGGGGGGG
jgi:hypothetical protein